MFIFNVNLNKTKFFKLIFVIMAIVCVSLACTGFYKIYEKSKNTEYESFNENCMPSGKIAYLNDKNYTNVLREVHENLDTYIGQEICYTGYVYRVPDIEPNQFILARDMQIANTNQTVIVGFLCTCNNANEFDTYSWVTITGEIQKGDYFGDIPCIQVSEIKPVQKPENCIVPEPSESYIQTSVIY